MLINYSLLAIHISILVLKESKEKPLSLNKKGGWEGG
jgi:hypothetical protein